MSSVQLVDVAGQRSPATMLEFHAGRPPRNKGRSYPADPPTLDEIVTVMRHARQAPRQPRLNGLIVVLCDRAATPRSTVADRDRSGPAPRFDSGQARQGQSPT